MENIILDGRLDEVSWAGAKEYSDFTLLKKSGGARAEVQTHFKVLACEDRVYIGVKCDEPDVPYVKETHHLRSRYGCDRVEFFISPSGTPFDFYQFMVTFGGYHECFYYQEGGGIQPDPYAPCWESAVYVGEDFWSMELMIPYTAFYMTANSRWSDKWRMNIARYRTALGTSSAEGGNILSTWSPLNLGFFDTECFRFIDGFPMRPLENDIRMVSAIADMTEITDDGYKGTLTVKTVNAVDGVFDFTSGYTETVRVALQAGENEFVVPCHFDSLGRHKVDLELKRVADGVAFQRFYPVLVVYEPIRIQFSLPEYRNNFYPGQDTSKIAGKVRSSKAVTLKLEGPGIPETVITPDADGSFCFETPGFEIGDAFLTATIEGYETVKKIRNLPPTERMMSWISGGNLVVNGKPVVRRNMYADRWHSGTAFLRRYDSEPQYQTPQVIRNKGYIQPDVLVKGIAQPGGAALRDDPPSEELLRKIDECMEGNSVRDFTYYYLYDEPECVGVSPIFLKYLYDYVSEKDPYHVILIASRACDTYVDCADWFETHPYINPNVREDGVRIYDRPFHTLGSYVDAIAKLNRPDKCIGFMPSAFAYKNVSLIADYPTFDEMICHTWAGMIRGGKSLWPFACMDLPDRLAVYEGMRYVYATFEILEDFILFAKRTTLLKTQDVEAVHYDLGDKQMFVLINLTQQPQQVTVEGLSGSWYEFRHARTITGNAFDLAPYQVVVGTSVEMGGDLPTYQELVEKVNAHEQERKQNKSLLFDRYQDIPITSSMGNRWNYKLFDGIHDNLAWEHLYQSKDRFMELDLTKVKPTFSKVVISGYNIANMDILVRNAGALTVPPIAERLTEEFSTTFLLAEPICPEALRLEFNNEVTELYEIEVF